MAPGNHLKTDSDKMDFVEESHLVQSLNDIGSADTNTRVDYVCELMSTCTGAEIKSIMNRINRVKKGIKRGGGIIEPAIRRRRARFLGAATHNAMASGAVHHNLEVRPLGAHLDSEPVPNIEPAPEPMDGGESASWCSDGEIAWFEDYWDEDIVAMDIEKVILRTKTDGIKNMAGVISVVSKTSKIVLTVYHHPDTFDHRNRTWRQITGFNKDSFKAGEPFSKVREKLEELLRDKLVIVCGGADDFKSIGLSMADFDVFDLHSHWKKNTVNANGVVTPQPLSLRALSLFYLKKDPQANIHSAEEDAQCTLELFDVYRQIKKSNISERLNFDFDEFDVIPRPDKLATKVNKR